MKRTQALPGLLAVSFSLVVVSGVVASGVLWSACAPPRLGNQIQSGDDMTAVSSDGGMAPTCDVNAPDQTGCSCTPSTSRACYPSSAAANTRHLGVCTDGTQACVAGGEFSTFGACQGATTPVTENCTDGIDNNCDGNVDCADPSCAVDPACNNGCTSGQMRTCYTGPTGTLGVGTCMGGTQVCVGGQWPTTCPGEVLPTAENCGDPLDHNCNHLPGCLDLFVCILSPACMGTCMPAMVDTGCVCPNGTGDTATCPDGMFGTTKGGSITSPGMDECCPCTSSDCGNAGCCAETACAGNPQCDGLVCKPLPSSCNGQVNADCDDFPEDCDEPCCKCTNCP